MRRACSRGFRPRLLALAGLGASISLVRSARSKVRARSARAHRPSRPSPSKGAPHCEPHREPPLGPRRPAHRRPLGGRDHPHQQERPGRPLDRKRDPRLVQVGRRTRSSSAAGCSCSAASASSPLVSGLRVRLAEAAGPASHLPSLALVGAAMAGLAGMLTAAVDLAGGIDKNDIDPAPPPPFITPWTCSSSARSSLRSCRSPL